MLDIKRIPIPALIGLVLTGLFVLAAIFAAAIEELTGDDYSEAQQQAWASAADDDLTHAVFLDDEIENDAVVRSDLRSDLQREHGLLELHRRRTA